MKENNPPTLNVREIKTFCANKSREFINRPVLQGTVKSVLQAKGKLYRPETWIHVFKKRKRKKESTRERISKDLNISSLNLSKLKLVN